MEIKTIKIKDLQTNDGQIEGLPKNPRQIRDHRYEKLKKSIEDAPEMLQLRELLVYPHGGKFVIIGGNMRYRACKEIGYKELPCKVLDADTTPEKLREYAIKDNESFGQYDWDILANEWDADEVEGWGVELPVMLETGENPYTTKVDIPQYEVKGEMPTLGDCYDTEKADHLIQAIDESGVSDAEKRFLKEAAKRHTVFNYQKIAEYYADASPEMQQLMERSALVIIDVDSAMANGYTELGESIMKLMGRNDG